MELISNYLSKPVISIYEAAMQGTVINATFDKKMRRVCSLLIVSDNDEVDVVYSIPIARIVTVDNALTIKNSNSIRQYLESNIFVKCPINLPVYTTNGLIKGIIRDVLFDAKTFLVSEIILDEMKIPAETVVSVSNSLVIIKGEGFTRLQPPRAPRRRQISEDQLSFDDKIEEEEEIEDKQIPLPIDKPFEKRCVFPEENIEEEDTETPIIPIKEEKTNIPTRIISDYSFLLGRMVLANVYNTSAELIIPANTRITVETVEKARRYGKLVELTVGSRLLQND